MVRFKVINDELRINKVLTKLDAFAFDVINIIEKYTKYIIVSGYVSIFFGRSRATEDIDMLITGMGYDDFLKMYNDFLGKGFEFTIDDPEDLYNRYLMQGTAINVWRKNLPLLRMEIKIARKLGQKLVIQNPLKVYVNDKIIFFSQIEAQIAYKRYSASEKDLEDARHLEIVFDGLDSEKIKYFEDLFNKE
ncbi:hypothetical protein KY330_00495 [Candidatus Woesearchaeota archaeon]|nr:hypothetical protein [Candidatus Woesearchaeota archaeon]